ncbi:hypothetical protein Tco_0978448 [Tanacetum coccineum]|uniref:Reverse transcriptase domain-containing protein n=1 Tax=Tanacetum coccineum TaxID=301880 RepID=A0ABQ5EMZ6_9ASTR
MSLFVGSTCVVQEEGRFISVVHRLSTVGKVGHQESPQDQRLVRPVTSFTEIRYHPRKANVVADALSEASKVENATAKMLRGLDQLMERKEDGGMYFIWVPLIGDVRTLIMDEAHASRYLVHPGADKMYYDLRDMHGGHV